MCVSVGVRASLHLAAVAQELLAVLVEEQLTTRFTIGVLGGVNIDIQVTANQLLGQLASQRVTVAIRPLGARDPSALALVTNAAQCQGLDDRSIHVGSAIVNVGANWLGSQVANEQLDASALVARVNADLGIAASASVDLGHFAVARELGNQAATEEGSLELEDSLLAALLLVARRRARTAGA